MSNMRSIRSSFIAALLLLAGMQSVPITEAITLPCTLGCLSGCIGTPLPTYPLCLVSCLILACKWKPPVSTVQDNHPQTIISDPRLQCKVGCVMVKCMSDPNRSSKDKKTRECIHSCVVGCHEPITKN